MAYQLKGVTIRTNNTQEGVEKIAEVWRDIASGKLPLLYDSSRNVSSGVSLVARYSNYASDENGDYDLSIIDVSPSFFGKMEKAANYGMYKKYDEFDDNGDTGACVKRAWGKVWDEQRTGVIKRKYSEDYEVTIPAEYADDGKARCCLYIAVKE